MEIDGQVKAVTQADLRSLRLHPDASLRARARARLLETYDKNIDVYTFLLTSVAKDHSIECEMRGFEHPMDPENTLNEIERSLVLSVIDVNRERLGAIHSYYEWKGKVLGLEKVKSSDLGAPLSGNRKVSIPWDRAREWVEESMFGFDHHFGARGRSFFVEERIDATPRKGKDSGGFCYPVPEKGAFILINYTGDLAALITLAHEIGHGVHFVESMEHHSLIPALRLPKLLAEVASEFNELVLADYLLGRVTDAELRAGLLGFMVDRFLATVDRQLMYTEFEIRLHEAIAKQAVATKHLSDWWLEVTRDHFGPSVELCEHEAAAWAIVPHFIFNPFYCYSYALSEIVAYALFARYREKGKSFVADYAELLRSGGSKPPLETLLEAGVDLSKPETLHRAYDELEARMERLRKEVS